MRGAVSEMENQTKTEEFCFFQTRIGRVLCPNLGEDQKKAFTRIWTGFVPPIR